MEREKQLRFCKVCKNQKFDIAQGIVCGLTGQKATFDLECDRYEEDARLKEQQVSKDLQNGMTNKISSQGTRFANFLLDFLFLLLFNFLGAFVLVFILSLFSPQLFQALDSNRPLIFFLVFGVNLFYYTILEYASGRSLAKYITKTKVVTEKGENPGFQAIVIRSLCRFIPFDALSFLGGEESGWHDRISGTRVISRN